MIFLKKQLQVCLRVAHQGIQNGIGPKLTQGLVRLLHIVVAVLYQTLDVALTLIEFVQVTVLEQDSCVGFVRVERNAVADGLHCQILPHRLELFVGPVKIFRLQVSIFDMMQRFL